MYVPGSKLDLVTVNTFGRLSIFDDTVACLDHNQECMLMNIREVNQEASENTTSLAECENLSVVAFQI